jgi:hypothetical protein
MNGTLRNRIVTFKSLFIRELDDNRHYVGVGFGDAMYCNLIVRGHNQYHLHIDEGWVYNVPQEVVEIQ